MSGDPDWRDYAACIGYDTEIWYPTSADPRSTAVLICHTCPVITACLNAALELGDQHGVWGGMTAEDRKNLRRRERRSGNPVGLKGARRG